MWWYIAWHWARACEPGFETERALEGTLGLSIGISHWEKKLIRTHQVKHTQVLLKELLRRGFSILKNHLIELLLLIDNRARRVADGALTFLSRRACLLYFIWNRRLGWNRGRTETTNSKDLLKRFFIFYFKLFFPCSMLALDVHASLPNKHCLSARFQSAAGTDDNQKQVDTRHSSIYVMLGALASEWIRERERERERDVWYYL